MSVILAHVVYISVILAVGAFSHKWLAHMVAKGADAAKAEVEKK